MQPQPSYRLKQCRLCRGYWPANHFPINPQGHPDFGCCNYCIDTDHKRQESKFELMNIKRNKALTPDHAMGIKEVSIREPRICVVCKIKKGPISFPPSGGNVCVQCRR